MRVLIAGVMVLLHLNKYGVFQLISTSFLTPSKQTPISGHGKSNWSHTRSGSVQYAHSLHPIGLLFGSENTGTASNKVIIPAFCNETNIA